MKLEDICSLIRITKDKAMRIRSMDGSALLELDRNNSNDLISSLKSVVPYFESFDRVQIFTGSTLSTANATKGHAYIMEDGFTEIVIAEKGFKKLINKETVDVGRYSISIVTSLERMGELITEVWAKEKLAK